MPSPVVFTEFVSDRGAGWVRRRKVSGAVRVLHAGAGAALKSVSLASPGAAKGRAPRTSRLPAGLSALVSFGEWRVHPAVSRKRQVAYRAGRVGTSRLVY